MNSSCYWLGLDLIHYMTYVTRRSKLRVEMLTTAGSWISAQYDSFQVDNETTG